MIHNSEQKSRDQHQFLRRVYIKLYFVYITISAKSVRLHHNELENLKKMTL